MLLEDQEKTAFWASNRRWQWIVMPSDPKNAGACFQKVMDDKQAHHPSGKCYMDYVLIYSTTFEQHLAHIRQAFDTIATMGLKADPSKCVFDEQEVPYIRHALSACDVRPMDAKV